MDNQAYQQRVHALAEKMAEAVKPKQWYTCFRERAEISAQFLPAARIAVAERAEGFRQGWYAAVGNSAAEKDQCEAALKEQGLIPDNAQEGAKDGK